MRITAKSKYRIVAINQGGIRDIIQVLLFAELK